MERVTPAGAAPLAGIRVIDLTRLLPGPLCSLYLADLGAEVIKVEHPEGGDYARKDFGQTEAANSKTSIFFEAANRGKKSVALDLTDADGRDAFLRLIAGADVLIESFRPGVMARLGLDYTVLATSNPRLIYVSITGYGQDGPLRDKAGHDLNYLAMAGVLDQFRDAGGTPVIPGIQIADMFGGACSPSAPMAQI